MNLVLKYSPGFKEKLAEREEAMPVGRILFHMAFFRAANIRTIKIGRKFGLKRLATFQQLARRVQPTSACPLNPGNFNAIIFLVNNYDFAIPMPP